MIVVTVFIFFNQMKNFHLVQNRKENCHHDHILFNFCIQLKIQFSQRMLVNLCQCGQWAAAGVFTCEWVILFLGRYFGRADAIALGGSFLLEHSRAFYSILQIIYVAVYLWRLLQSSIKVHKHFLSSACKCLTEQQSVFIRHLFVK